MSANKRWKALEREAAAALGGKRVIRECWLQSDTDVRVPDFPELSIDAKAYRRFAHHALMEEIVRKYGGEPVLVTKHFNQTGAFATVRIEFLGNLLNQVRELRALKGAA